MEAEQVVEKILADARVEAEKIKKQAQNILCPVFLRIDLCFKKKKPSASEALSINILKGGPRARRFFLI